MLPAPDVIGHPWIELQSVDSTNNYATALVHAGMAHHGTAVFAHEQSKGKGQRNKVWQSGKGQNIILSVIIVPKGLDLTQLFTFTMAVAGGVFSFFNKYGGDKTRIKWPNDIFWCDRKAGGILIENVIQGAEWKYSVAGIGLNVNQTVFNELGTKAVSIKQITGISYPTVTLAKELCNHLQIAIENLKASSDTTIRYYHQHLYKRGELVKFRNGNRLFEATVKGVTTGGQLIVHHATEELFNVGDLDWMIIS